MTIGKWPWFSRWPPSCELPSLEASTLEATTMSWILVLLPRFTMLSPYFSLRPASTAHRILEAPLWSWQQTLAPPALPYGSICLVTLFSMLITSTPLLAVPAAAESLARAPSASQVRFSCGFWLLDKCTSSCPGSCSSSRACCANNSYNQCGFYTAYGDGTRYVLLASVIVLEPLAVSSSISFLPSTSRAAASTTWVPPSEASSTPFSTVPSSRYMTGLLDNTDGILGLAYKSLACSPSCINTFYDDMIEQHSGFKNEFTMCFGSKEGILAYGGADTGLYVCATPSSHS